jgi:hypothetical protein
VKYPAKASAGDRPPVPAGTHIAICDIVADLGIQPGSGMYPAPKRKVYIRFELPNERIDFEKDGKKQNGPAVISKTYTASMNEKANLRKDMEGWRGEAMSDEKAEDFDVAVVLGKACMLSITHTQKGEKTYANIVGISKLMKGIDAKTLIPEITPVYYGPDNPSTYASLPDWLKKLVDSQIQEEKKQSPTTPEPGDDFPPGTAYDGTEITDDDLPF